MMFASTVSSGCPDEGVLEQDARDCNTIRFQHTAVFVVAAVAERDISRWKLGLDISLLAVLYNVIRTSFSFNCSY